jgi:uncharacterized protein (TIGR00661 family)
MHHPLDEMGDFFCELKGTVGQKKILVAPLDWGLGHATRCIPIINELLHSGFEVIIASEGAISVLLKEEFPNLTFLHLRGYKISYAKTKTALIVKMFLQIPKILRSISHEHQWLKEVIVQHEIDAVISDNRYGLYHSRIYSIFITHQLRIQTPFFGNLMQYLNYRFINHFCQCWIPDVERAPGAAGLLSHPYSRPTTPVKYIGLLSRLKPLILEEEIQLLVILSGPEPQRTLFEKKILTALNQKPLTAFIVRGLPSHPQSQTNQANVTLVNHLPSAELEKLIARSRYILARSGYSTIMDLVRMRKKLILVPTPGQTEQEYLAKHLMQNRYALCIPQQQFHLESALRLADKFVYQSFEDHSATSLQQAVQELSVVLG